LKDNTEIEREKYNELTDANKGREKNDRFNKIKKLHQRSYNKEAILKIMIAMEKEKSERKEKINY